MYKVAVLVLACMVPAVAGFCIGGFDDERILGRGDVNNDHHVNVTDVIYLNNYLYNGGPAPPCLNQADTNGDGRVDVSDPIYLLNWLYSGGPAPPAPGPYNTTCATASKPLSCSVGC